MLSLVFFVFLHFSCSCEDCFFSPSISVFWKVVHLWLCLEECALCWLTDLAWLALLLGYECVVHLVKGINSVTETVFLLASADHPAHKHTVDPRGVRKWGYQPCCHKKRTVILYWQVQMPSILMLRSGKDGEGNLNWVHTEELETCSCL